MADIIGKINCHAIVIDYTRNAHSTEVFTISHERFYKKIRQYHPNIPIILMTSECFNGWTVYDDFDEIVKKLGTVGYIHEGDLGIKDREAFKYTDKPHLMSRYLPPAT